MSVGLSMTDEEVKKTIDTRVKFVKEYIENSIENIDLIDLRKKFEGYYNKEGKFIKGYLQKRENKKVPTKVSEGQVYNNGVYYYECTKRYPKRYLNESGVYSIYYTKYYTKDNLISNQINYYDKEGNRIDIKHSNELDLNED